LSRTAMQHGEELLRSGFSVAQVVHGYGDVCQVVAEVAGELDVPIRVEELRVFNCCLDEAVAQALSEYARLHELSIAAKGAEPMGVFAHELRTLISGAALAFDTLRDGHVPASGKTAAVLGRSLQRMRELVDRSLAEVRLQAHLHHPQCIRIAEVLEEIEISAAAEAKARELQLVVHDVSRDISVLGDRPLLTSSLANLVQNALKFTRAHSTVTVRVRTTAQRVFVDVEDECGGRPAGQTEQLFQPLERGADTSGLGLGLLISRRAITANYGTLSARDAPGIGCIVTAELPRYYLELAHDGRPAHS
jgi:signal transduction histidine kinase